MAVQGFRAFLSAGTVISGLLSAGLFSLQFGWAVGLSITVMLYLHEAGHVLAALWRRVRVRRPPFFLPGFGAFVAVEIGDSPWDHVVVALGGPVIGGLAGGAACWLGDWLGLPHLVLAGVVGLALNLLNLAPLLPFDGGRVLAQSGWVGLVPTLAVGGLLLVRHPGIVLAVVAGVALLHAVSIWRVRVPMRWINRAGVVALYLLAVAGLAAGLFFAPTAPSATHIPPDWMPNPLWFYGVLMLIHLGGLAAGEFARGRIRSPLLRHTLQLLLGWPAQLMEDPWLVPVTACSAAAAARLTGMGGLRALAARLARAESAAGGEAVAAGADLLVSRGEDPQPWLEETFSPLLYPATAAEAIHRLRETGHRALARGLALQAATAWGASPPALPPERAHHLAELLLAEGEPALALPYATMAACEPARADRLEILGNALTRSGLPQQGEEALRRALALRERPALRIALARALTAQERYPEAIVEVWRGYPWRSRWNIARVSKEMGRILNSGVDDVT